MAKILEVRHLMRRYTLADAESGVQPIRQTFPNPELGGRPIVRLYSPPTLQIRTRERVHVDGQPTLEWGPWTDVLIEREDDQPEGGV